MQEASETVKLPGDVAADGTKLVNKVLELLNVGPCAVDMKVRVTFPVREDDDYPSKRVSLPLHHLPLRAL